MKNFRLLNCIIYRGYPEPSEREVLGVPLQEKIMTTENHGERFGSNAHIERVLAEYSDSIIKLCYTYTKNIHDAEDIAQETFIALIRHGEAFESAEHEKAWLLRTAVNKCKNHVKSGWVKNTVPIDETTEEPSQDFDPDEGSEVLEAVQKLPEKYRLPIHLFYYEGYSINDIAGIIGKKPATVGTLLARARERLKEILKGGNSN